MRDPQDDELVSWMREKGIAEYERSPERIRVVLGPEPVGSGPSRGDGSKDAISEEAKALARKRAKYKREFGYELSDEHLARLP